MAEINDITAKAPQNAQLKKTAKQSLEGEDLKATTPREPDRVEIRGSEAGNPEKDDVTVSEEDLKRYTAMLTAMPDSRDDEVARVEAILAEDGYGPDAIAGVANALINEGLF